MCAVCSCPVGGNEQSVMFGAAAWCSRKNPGLGARRPGFSPSCLSLSSSVAGGELFNLCKSHLLIHDFSKF